VASRESIAVIFEEYITEDKLVIAMCSLVSNTKDAELVIPERTSRRVDKNVTVNTAEIVVRLNAETAYSRIFRAKQKMIKIYCEPVTGSVFSMTSERT
jgi:hypothetical protein